MSIPQWILGLPTTKRTEALNAYADLEFALVDAEKDRTADQKKLDQDYATTVSAAKHKFAAKKKRLSKKLDDLS